MKYGNSSLWKKFISSPFILVLIIVLFLFLIKTVWSIREKNTLSLNKLQLANIEFQKLESHREDLAEQINYLLTEQGIESELRTKYRAIREGESVAVIVDNTETSSATSSSSTDAIFDNKNSWFKSLLRSFGF